MGFAEEQIRQLGSKLLERHVRTREERGLTLSYIEGWHAIAEANRIFGFDGWDRETLAAECVWQDGRGSVKACAYTARVRIRVRAGDTIVYRDGSGSGHGTATTMGEAHESALKEAETDATKRALTTFGNPFGLALYDKEKAGIRRMAIRRAVKGGEPSTSLVLYGPVGETLSVHQDPQRFCKALKEAICTTTAEAVLSELWARNRSVLEHLRITMPHLLTAKGHHYVDILVRWYERQGQRLRAIGTPPDSRIEPMPDAPVEPAVSSPLEPAAPEHPIDKSGLAIATPRRIRDEQHLRFVASQPCLVCGRTPAQAHHLRFAQPRSMGSKVSDEWTVPLCFLHHRALHDVGSEEAWWGEKGIDAKAEAQRLWGESHERISLSLPPQLSEG